MCAVTSNPLLGTWSLVRWEISYADKRPSSFPYGQDATGLIVYSNDGWMSACISAPQRARLSSDSVRSAPVEERLAAFESYFQYSGRYLIEEGTTGLQVVHDVSHSLNPNFVGSRQIRKVDFDEQGNLMLSASDRVPASDVLRHHRLIWRRTTS
jgi:Lipocalin-like domain